MDSLPAPLATDSLALAGPGRMYQRPCGRCRRLNWIREPLLDPSAIRVATESFTQVPNRHQVCKSV